MSDTIILTISNASPIDISYQCYGSFYDNFSDTAGGVLKSGTTALVKWDKDGAVAGGGALATGDLRFDFYVADHFTHVDGPLTQTWPGFKFHTVQYTDGGWAWDHWQLADNQSVTPPQPPIPMPFSLPGVTVSQVSMPIALISFT